MMMNDVVKKISDLSDFLADFSRLLSSDCIRNLARTRTSDFTRNRNMNFFKMILYFIFRCRKTTNEELGNFYSSICQPNMRISKQALFKAAGKLNPNVLTFAIREFASRFYRSSLPVKLFDRYHVIAEDGSYNEIPYAAINIFDFHFPESKKVRSPGDVNVVHSQASGLYDVMNGFFLNYTLKRADYSEIPLAFKHLYESRKYFRDSPVIYLADRYYGSAEIISFLEHMGYFYVIRGKKNFYKKEIASMRSDDEWISVNVDKTWRKRFRFSPESVEEREATPLMRIRVIKRKITYIDSRGEEKCETTLLFTNLPEKEASSDLVAYLYTLRWNIESSYKNCKEILELERFFSADGDMARCSILGKIIFHNICGIISSQMNAFLDEMGKESMRIGKKKNRHAYKINLSQLQKTLRDNGLLGAVFSRKRKRIEEIIMSTFSIIHKIKVPIRPNRHFKRWGRVLTTPPGYRFRIDGRNYPKVKRFKGCLMTTAP
jgi:hypothetical protein